MQGGPAYAQALAVVVDSARGCSAKAGDTQKVEQRNRELHNRAYNLQGGIAELGQRLKPTMRQARRPLRLRLLRCSTARRRCRAVTTFPR